MPDSATPSSFAGLQVRNLRFSYPGNSYELAIDSLTVETGEHVALVGASGSGKTTLLHLMSGILPPKSGELELGGIRIDQLSEGARRDFRLRQLGMIFQEFELLDHLSVQDNVLLPYWIDPRLTLDRPVKERAGELLERSGLAHLARRKPAALSQGERQRVGICRALITRPSILLADEPTGNLDPSTTVEILDAILEAAKTEGATLIFVTHDHTLLDRLDRVIDLSDLIQEGAA